VVEDICLYARDLPLPGQRATATYTFALSAARLDANARATERELLKGGVRPDAAADVSADVSRGLSALGCWPRLFLDPHEALVVESRSSSGAPQPSHWQTVLPLLADAPRAVAPGDVCAVAFSVTHAGAGAEAPVAYAVSCQLRSPPPCAPPS
jgi:hypothetical protein